MSPLVRKELRALVPPWILAMVLASVPIWLVWPAGGSAFAVMPVSLVYGPFFIGILLLSLTPFGQELNWGTFSILLAQPVSRAMIWRVKALLVGIALLLVLLAFCVSVDLRVDSVMSAATNTIWHDLLTRPGGDRQLQIMIAETRHQAHVGSLIIGGLSALAGFAGGLWTTLLFRQVSAAFWFTLLVPMGLGLLVTQLLGGLSEVSGQAGVCAILGLYSAAGFVWARRLFQNVQDTQWTGGVVSLPEWSGAGTLARAGVGRRKRRRLRALLGKEFQAQYVNLLLAGGLLLIHAVVLLVRRLNLQYLAAHRTLGMTLESFPILWLALPLLVGSIAIAEERKLGTFESVSCLPVSRRLQFSVKLALALILGIVLGAVAPMTLEYAGTLAGLPANSSMMIGGEVMTLVLSLVSISALGALTITLLAFYGSSLTHNTLQALGSGVLACITASLLIVVAAHPPSLDGVFLWGPLLLALTLAPALAVVVIVLAYRNYRRVRTSLSLWRRNVLALVGALVAATAVSTAVYHRFWEAWLPLEPPHGYGTFYGARDRHATATPKVQATTSRIAALLPDGRLWLRQRAVKMAKIVQGSATFFFPQPKGRAQTGFAPGSNWRDIAVSDLGSFAIQTDGTLWDLSGLQPGSRNAEATLKRVGDGQNWMKIAGGWGHYCALKSDGTLWQWGYRLLSGTGWASTTNFLTPTQVGTDMDWVAVADSFQSSIVVKADGTIWRWGHVQHWSTNGPSRSETLARPKQWLAFPGPQRLTSISFDGYSVAAVCDDGSLWVGGNLLFRLLGPEATQRASTQMVRLGNDSDWESVELLGTLAPVGIKRDGSLWKWDVEEVIYFRGGWTTPPVVPVSHYSVWTSACPYGNAFLALGRDDTICLWGDANPDNYFDRNGPDPRRLLLPSRINAREIADLRRDRD